MKFELRHIIPILILVTLMTGCTDSPLPDAAPEEPARPLSFTIPSATLDPTYPLSRATDPNLTEEIVLWQGEQVFPNKGEKLIFENSYFIKNKPAVGGKITVGVKDLKELEDDKSDDNTPQKCPRIRFILGSGFDYWFDNKKDNGQTPDWEENGFSYYQITINETIAEKMQKLDLRIQVNCCTLTKISYTAMRTEGLIYDGLHTQFIDGSLLGCVIAYKNATGGYDYKANSCWTWHEQGLTLTKLFDADNQQLDITDNSIIRHFTDEECAEIDKADDPLKPYFIKLLDETAEYAFFFYYPYVDEEIITETYKDTQDGTAYKISNVSYPTTYGASDLYEHNFSIGEINKYNLTYQVGATESTNTSKLLCAAWRTYPVAVSTDYSIGDVTRLHNSDFMYCKLTGTAEGMPITKANAKSEMRVTMQKKFVTMDFYVLQSDVIEGSLKLKPGQVNYTDVMMRIKRFDFLQGKFIDDFTFNQWQGTIFEKNTRFLSKVNEQPAYIIPRKIGTSSEMINGEPTVYDVYRVILPPQDASQFRCSLTFKVKGDGNERELTLHDMHQNSGIKSLLEGHYYKLRFTKLNEQYGFHLDIDDWEKGDEITIDRPD